jgi:Phosphodiester glycosidase
MTIRGFLWNRGNTPWEGFELIIGQRVRSTAPDASPVACTVTFARSEERPVPSVSSTPPEYSMVPHFGVRASAENYSRFLVRYTRREMTAQVIVVAQNRLRMAVHAHDDALDVNFSSHQVTNPHDADTYRDRPGFYLHEKLAELADKGISAIILNGNNIGYWGNQYVIEDKQFKYKQRGPLFDDGKLLAHANGDHAFFVETNGTFRIKSLALAGTQRAEGATLENLRVVTPRLPRFGLSGFPLLRDGKPVWRKHGALAWDPGLLFDLGRIEGYTTIELRNMVEELLDSGAKLARHPMTVVGIDAFGQVVLLVVERSRFSGGMTVEEAAVLLRRRFQVQDAIVLGAAQLATTEEGFLTEPLIAEHAIPTARRIPDELLAPDLKGRDIYARPVPCYVVFELTDCPSWHSLRALDEPAGMA